MSRTDPALDARLHALLLSVQARWGADAVQPLSQLRTAKPGLRTGFAGLDAALAPDGIPQGAVTVLAGVPTGGMMTLAYRTLALAQAEDGCIVYIDGEGTFDAASAATMGIDLARLFLVRPETPLEALDLARDLLGRVPVPALVLDAGMTAPRPESVRRLNGALHRGGPALLILTWAGDRHDVRQLVELPAALRLLFERIGWLERGGDVVGARVRVFRLNGGERERLVELDIFFDGQGGSPP